MQASGKLSAASRFALASVCDGSLKWWPRLARLWAVKLPTVHPLDRDALAQAEEDASRAVRFYYWGLAYAPVAVVVFIWLAPTLAFLLASAVEPVFRPAFERALSVGSAQRAADIAYWETTATLAGVAVIGVAAAFLPYWLLMRASMRSASAVVAIAAVSDTRSAEAGVLDDLAAFPHMRFALARLARGRPTGR